VIVVVLKRLCSVQRKGVRSGRDRGIGYGDRHIEVAELRGAAIDLGVTRSNVEAGNATTKADRHALWQSAGRPCKRGSAPRVHRDSIRTIVAQDTAIE